MTGSFLTYFFVALWLILATGFGFLYWRLSQLENRKDRLVSMYLDQQQQQISALQRDLARLASRVEQAPRVESGLSPYNQAIEMIKQGLSATEVAAQCGISRSEAELIVSLYRNSPTS